MGERKLLASAPSMRNCASRIRSATRLSFTCHPTGQLESTAAFLWSWAPGWAGHSEIL